MIYATEFAPFLHHNFSDTKEHCEYDLRIFPSGTLEAQFRTNRPFIYMAVVVAVFLVTALVFVIYDWLVTVRQNKVMATAKRTNAIVSSLFPKNVRDRIMQEAQEQAEQDLQNQKGSIFRAGAKTKLKMFLDEDIAEQDQTKTFDSKPIADLFPGKFDGGQGFAHHGVASTHLFFVDHYRRGHYPLCRYRWFYCVELRSRTSTGVHPPRDTLCRLR